MNSFYQASYQWKNVGRVDSSLYGSRKEEYRMNKGGGVGVGSASIVLVFAVLCLSVFSLITFVVAGNSMALVESEARLVTGYYEADLLAERITAEILATYPIPETILGVDVDVSWDWEQDADIIQFGCPMPENEKTLYVKLAIYMDSYEILSWRMWDTGDWVIDEGKNVWLGPDDDMDASLILGLG